MKEEEPYWFWGQKVKGQGRCYLKLNFRFRTLSWLLYRPPLPNLVSCYSYERGRTLLILGSKGQRSRSLLPEIEFSFPDSKLTCCIGHLYQTWSVATPMKEEEPYWFWGQKVKGQGHCYLKLNFRFRTLSWLLYRPPLPNLVSCYSYERGRTLLILGSKVKVAVNWNWIFVSGL